MQHDIDNPTRYPKLMWLFHADANVKKNHALDVIMEDHANLTV